MPSFILNSREMVGEFLFKVLLLFLRIIGNSSIVGSVVRQWLQLQTLDLENLG